ncbi:hypothetical protein [Lysinibacillus cavernae]|uniref:hypothetical protein n=1 Tax=Lysinibacillus cavernae TaxID=2666135 RepID=UPI0012D915B3|nr:hypothetical protein [Lysinibacillus cavernae]
MAKNFSLLCFTETFNYHWASSYLFHLIAGTVYQRMALAKNRGVIEETLIKRYGYADQQYLLDITSGLTIHVNHPYFNVNTYLLLFLSPYYA